MTISRRVVDWFSSLAQAAFVVALVPAALAWADCPGDACEKCKSCPLATVDWTAIYLGNFATGCALTESKDAHECTVEVECGEACFISGSWCPGPSVMAHDPCQVIASSGDWGLRIDGSTVSLAVDSLSAFTAPPLDCPCDESSERDLFHAVRWKLVASEGATNEQDSEVCPLQLKPGEPALEILEVARRLGPGPLHGTIFDDESATEGHAESGLVGNLRMPCHSESLARAIQALEARERAQQYDSPNIEAAFEDSVEPESIHVPETFDRAERVDPQASSLGATTARIEALRQAGKMLEKAANLLEEQNLYERADELRGQAQFLREDAREAKAHFLDPNHGKPDPRQARILRRNRGIMVNR